MHRGLLALGTIFCIVAPKGISSLNASDFDDVRHYSVGDYNLTIYSTDTRLNAAVRQRISELYFRVYPQLVVRFNRQAPRAVEVYIDGQSTDAYWGSAIDFTIIIYARRLQNPALFPRYYEIFLHELAHLAQQYTTQNLKDVKWLGEGLADYVRYTYGTSSLDADWPLPDYSPQQAFNDGYKVTARFLMWLEKRYNSSVIDRLDQGLREVTYEQNSTWKILTGKSVEDLWEDYSRNPELIRSVPLLLKNGTVEKSDKFLF